MMSGKQRTQIPVWFNPDHLTMYDIIRAKGLTTQTFPEFVKYAFYDKIDQLNIQKDEVNKNE